MRFVELDGGAGDAALFFDLFLPTAFCIGQTLAFGGVCSAFEFLQDLGQLALDPALDTVGPGGLSIRTGRAVRVSAGQTGCSRFRYPVQGTRCWAADVVGGRHMVGPVIQLRDPQADVVPAHTEAEMDGMTLRLPYWSSRAVGAVTVWPRAVAAAARAWSSRSARVLDGPDSPSNRSLSRSVSTAGCGLRSWAGTGTGTGAAVIQPGSAVIVSTRLLQFGLSTMSCWPSGSLRNRRISTYLGVQADAVPLHRRLKGQVASGRLDLGDQALGRGRWSGRWQRGWLPFAGSRATAASDPPDCDLLGATDRTVLSGGAARA